MTKVSSVSAFLALALGWAQTEPAAAWNPVKGIPTALAEVGHPTFVSPHATPIAEKDGRVFVVNTPTDTVDVIDTASRRIVARVRVGIDPVSLAVRPDGKEVWVSNHVSDSVSVIDADPESPTHLHVVATVQAFDAETKSTLFDEPVGIAFANDAKAYVALSSENEIAVVDVATRRVTKRLEIKAQDPRAIVVRGDRLYVVPFESNNKTQLSGGARDEIDGKLVTFDAWNHSIANNNVLSLGHVTDIVKHPEVPDRDLFVFDTKTDELVESVDTLGTLLYGLAVDSKGRAFIAQTDARNDVNGRAGTKKHGLQEMENRAFLNRITRVTFEGGKSKTPEFFDLEPLPPKHPEPANALATPFAIEVSADDATLVASAAGSDKVFTVDAESGQILARVKVGAVPRGIALEHSGGTKLSRAWVLNAVANTVSVLDLGDRKAPKVVATITLEDPTHAAIKRGRIAFNTARASTTKTFSCASCHPDGHTDQLLWVLKTPIVSGGNQIMPRSTMPIRGLRDTAPYHWDGIPGDPYGGNNSANIRKSVEPTSRLDDPTSTTRHLIDGGLASTMALVGDDAVNQEGKAGALTAAERDDMAKFLLNVPYPPAQKRAYTNEVSKRALEGFKLFHIDGDLDGKARPNVCGNCHRFPFLVSTNTPGTGMDAPTWRGANDRFLILPQGRLNIIAFDFYRRVAEKGIPERAVWQFSWGGRDRFDPVWDMVLEGSTGYSGSFARQVTLSRETADDELTRDLLDALELSASEGAVVLETDGAFLLGATSEAASLQYDPSDRGGVFVDKHARRKAYSASELLKLADDGKFVGTITARHGRKATYDNPQPGIWTLSAIERQSGRQEFPILFDRNREMTIHGRHIDDGARVFVDGRRVFAVVSRGEGERLHIKLPTLPAKGLHLLQLQNADGMFSNDFIFHVVEDAEAALEYKRRQDRAHQDMRVAMADAIREGDLDKMRALFRRRASRHDRHPRTGARPLSDAAFHGHVEVVKLLFRRGTRPNETNRDGNSPLHIAAFLGRFDIVELLLERGASVALKNRSGDTPIDSVTGEWDDGLKRFYESHNRSAANKVDVETMKETRAKMAKLLREHQEKSRKKDDGDAKSEKKAKEK